MWNAWHKRETANVFTCLEERCLLSSDEDGRLQMHDVIRWVARRALAQPGSRYQRIGLRQWWSSEQGQLVPARAVSRARCTRAIYCIGPNLGMASVPRTAYISVQHTSDSGGHKGQNSGWLATYITRPGVLGPGGAELLVCDRQPSSAPVQVVGWGSHTLMCLRAGSIRRLEQPS